jgi:SpoVK/Ycf46/Vps4 family AAA+-type ATPase
MRKQIRNADPVSSAFAKRVEITQTWDDLVLPRHQLDQITYLIARIRQRRLACEPFGFASALFSGPRGTGKTLVAALIAKELGLELYQVDLAKLGSKRNLAELFDAAEAGRAILLFDDADSLFDKRTDVKSSNVLQRLERFTGICLLTSKSNIDPAFQRRLSLHLRFELPDVAAREALWRAMIPTAQPKIVASLARRYAMSGGYIRDAALRAAFMAADEGSAITSAHLERAARFEYEGMGKIAA